MEHQERPPKGHVTHQDVRLPGGHHGLQIRHLLRHCLKQPPTKHSHESKGTLPRCETVALREHDAVEPRLINLFKWETTEALPLYDGASLAPSVEGYFMAALAQRVGDGYVGMDMTWKWPCCKEKPGH